MARPDDEVREELTLLLDGKFDLLNDPENLQQFLCDRCNENSKLMARRSFTFWDEYFSRPPGRWEQLFDLCVRSVNTIVRGTPSIRERNTQSLIKSVVDATLYLATTKSYYFKGSLGTATMDEAAERYNMPLHTLALLDCEVCKELSASQAHDLKIWNASIIPTGIGSIRSMAGLTIRSSTITSVPPSAFHGKPSMLMITKCPNLKTLSLHTMSSVPNITTFVIDSCSKEMLEEITLLPLKMLTIKDCSNIDKLPHLEKLASLKTLFLWNCSVSLIEQVTQLKVERLGFKLKNSGTALPMSILTMSELERFVWWGDETDPVFQSLLVKLGPHRCLHSDMLDW